MILGCYYVTAMDENAVGFGQNFIDINDARVAYEAG
jgi:hypothetical protein